MDEQEWEMIPHKILADLRDEVHILKDKMSQPSTRKDMVDSMIELKRSIDQMHDIFKTALDTTGKDDHPEILAKLANIEKQNEQIAQALVTVAELVEQMHQKKVQPAEPEQSFAPPPFAAPPSFAAPPQFAPPRSRAPSRASMPLPPPPPPAPRKGLLGKIMR